MGKPVESPSTLSSGPKGLSFDLEALDREVERWVSRFKWAEKNLDMEVKDTQ